MIVHSKIVARSLQLLTNGRGPCLISANSVRRMKSSWNFGSFLGFSCTVGCKLRAIGGLLDWTRLHAAIDYRNKPCLGAWSAYGYDTEVRGSLLGGKDALTSNAMEEPRNSDSTFDLYGDVINPFFSVQSKKEDYPIEFSETEVCKSCL